MAQVEMKKLPVSSQTKLINGVLVLIGAVSFAVLLKQDSQRAWTAYLTSFFFFINLALGGLFFASVQHVAKAGWSTTVRRVAEALSAFLPVALVLGLIFLAGAPKIYEWLHPEVVAGDALLQKKAAYLNFPFFSIRTVLFFGIWIFFAWKLVGNSLKQDENGDPQLTVKAVPYSILFLILFAFSYSLYTVDLLMSLHPHWFSTMFGVYCFAGLFQSSLATIILFTLFLMNRGLLKGLVGMDHIHDLGKFLFAFTVFYAYIAFSQFMLIWYANIPEETVFYLHRAHGGWMAISVGIAIFKFVVPFFALASRHAKRNVMVLSTICLLLLVMQWVEIFWLVYPNFNEGHLVVPTWEIGVFLGFLGLFMLSVLWFLSRFSVVAGRDPRIHEALHHHT